MEVLDIDIPVGGSLSLTPQEKTFLGRCFWGESEFTGYLVHYVAEIIRCPYKVDNIQRTPSFMSLGIIVFTQLTWCYREWSWSYFFGFHRLTFHRNVLDGEAEDDSPDHSQSHLYITVHNLWKANNPLKSVCTRLIIWKSDYHPDPHRFKYTGTLR